MKVRSALLAYINTNIRRHSRLKGAKHALDNFCDSFGFVAAGFVYWLHDWGIHSYSAGHRHHHFTGQHHSGA